MNLTPAHRPTHVLETDDVLHSPQYRPSPCYTAYTPETQLSSDMKSGLTTSTVVHGKSRG